MESRDTNRIIVGALIGGLIGGAALYFIKANRSEPLLGKINDAISEFGHILDEAHVDNTDEAIDDIEDSLPGGDNAVANALTLIATGINLWNKMKR
jgi:hypothetical protein